MRGREFFELASQMSQGSGASAMRSSVSGAYYGAFHVARDFVHVECRVNLPADAACHKKLHELFEACSLCVLIDTGRHLRSLREARNYADYKLEHAPSSTQSYAITHLEVARIVIAGVESGFAPFAKAQVVGEVRAKAAAVFRLIVRP